MGGDGVWRDNQILAGPARGNEPGFVRRTEPCLDERGRRPCSFAVFSRKLAGVASSRLALRITPRYIKDFLSCGKLLDYLSGSSSILCLANSARRVRRSQYAHTATPTSIPQPKSHTKGDLNPPGKSGLETIFGPELVV
ncbi:hypothetical protein ABW21_db0202479 [Orbilia brochopaga]|nr:hypothetical protein ABW21_db0202479 [Drechslerella brochopaga]